MAVATAALVLAAVGWLVVPPRSSAPTVASASGQVAAGSGPSSSGNATGQGGVPAAGSGPSAAGQTGGPGGPGSSASGTAASPSGPDGTAASGTGATGPGAPAGGQPAPVTGPSGQVTSPGGYTGPGAPSTAGCHSPPGTDQGVTASQIKVAFTLVNIVGPAGNAAFGVPSPSAQQADYQEVVDAVNASGGIACRHVVPLFFQGNPADSTNLQQTCLQIVEAQVFAVVDEGAYYGYPDLADCYPQHQIPLITQGLISNKEVSASYPYLFGRESMDVLYRNTVFALKQRGFFAPSSGFRKLGVVYRDCEAEVDTEFVRWLQQAGLSSGQIVTYDVGCPTGFASPSDLEQAVLKFQQAGVTNVTYTQFEADFSTFTTVAEQQGFRPKYGLPDDGVVPLTYSSRSPNFQNLAGATAISADLYGVYHTPGASPGPATARCEAIYTSHGGTPFAKDTEGDRTVAGEVCDQLWMLAAAAGHSPTLHRNQLAAGLQIARSVDFSFPWGPNDFSAPRVTFGDQDWRSLQFLTTCDCWRIADTSFHPSFS